MSVWEKVVKQAEARTISGTRASAGHAELFQPTRSKRLSRRAHVPYFALLLPAVPRRPVVGFWSRSGAPPARLVDRPAEPWRDVRQARELLVCRIAVSATSAFASAPQHASGEPGDSSRLRGGLGKCAARARTAAVTRDLSNFRLSRSESACLTLTCAVTAFG
jgi:hypothetical protein